MKCEVWGARLVLCGSSVSNEIQVDKGIGPELTGSVVLKKQGTGCLQHPDHSAQILCFAEESPDFRILGLCLYTDSIQTHDAS